MALQQNMWPLLRDLIGAWHKDSRRSRRGSMLRNCCSEFAAVLTLRLRSVTLKPGGIRL